MKALRAILIAIGLGSTLALLIIDAGAAFPWLVPVFAVWAVGSLIATKAPDNRLGWILLMTGAGGQAGFLLAGSVSRISDQQTAAWLDAVAAGISTAWVPILAYVLLVFPDGNPPENRWRHLRVPLFVATFVGFLAALLNGGWGGDIDQAAHVSPLRETTAPLGDVASAIFYPFFIAGFLGSAVSLIGRYRRSSGETRLQFKWLAYAAWFVFLSIVVLLATNGFSDVATDEPWESAVIAMAFAAIPTGIGIAALKYRLYDIDVVINKTVVLAILAGFITMTYALIAVGVGRLVGGEDGLLLPITATAFVALAFEPVRQRAQAWANRIVFGQKATPYEVLSNMTERLSHGEEAVGLLDRLAHLITDGTGADRVVIWLGVDGEMTAGSIWPPGDVGTSGPSVEPEELFPVTHNDEVVGAVEISKPKGTSLSTVERHLIEDIAGSIGAVLGYRKLNDSLEAKAEELAESRARLLDAQDEERRRLERDLHDGAQQLIVALKVKIGLARSLAARHDETELVSMLEGLVEEADIALDQVRNLARGIYPPVLQSDGLRAALSALAGGFPRAIEFDVGDLGRLDPDIEAAVYFQISEALTNAVKHTDGPVSVMVQRGPETLQFEVHDRGPGFDPVTVNGGSGLQNMRDRIAAIGGELVIESHPTAGTSIRGSVPVAQQARTSEPTLL